MTESPLHHDHRLLASEFFPRARERLTFDMPAGLADPHVIPPHDQHDADPVVLAAIAAVRPIKLAAVMVPIIERDELTVLFTQRTAHLLDHAGQISFPGGKIEAGDESPLAAVLREAEEEISLLMFPWKESRVIAYHATRAAAFALCASIMLLIGGAAEAANEMKCRKAVEQAWTELGVDKSDVVSTAARGRSVGGGKMTEAAVHARLKSCSGMLVVNLSKMCHVRDVYTTGDCRLPGVPAYP